jgi:hypothetical protein
MPSIGARAPARPGLRLLVAFALIGSGCVHRIQPSVAVDARKLAAIERRPERIHLVITKEYRSYASTDRGHALADPQRYEIGPALSEVTKRYFRAAFCQVTIGTDIAAAAPPSDFAVVPELRDFDNRLTFQDRQHFTLSLGASIVAAKGARGLAMAEARASTEHSIAMFTEEQRLRGEAFLPSVPLPADTGKNVGRRLGATIDAAVAQMVEQVAARIDAARAPDDPRSCEH